VSGLVPVISRSPTKFQMAVDGDTRKFVIEKGTNAVPNDFLQAWARQHWDSDLIKVLKWPGKGFGDYVRTSLPTSVGTGGMS
jgi:hypothetical protein